MSDFINLAKKLLKHCGTSGSFLPIQKLIRGKATILCYHRITCDDYLSLTDSENLFHPNIYLSVKSDRFESQLEHISREFEVSCCKQIIEDLSRDELKAHKIAVTFDDGYRDNLLLALPLLEKYEIPATIFITTGFIDKSTALWWEELGFIIQNNDTLHFEWDKKKLFFDAASQRDKEKAYLELNSLFKRLSADRQNELLVILRSLSKLQFDYQNLMLSATELAELAKHPLISIESHTVNHPILSHELEQVAFSEINDCRQILKKDYSIDSEFFAYPVGGLDEANTREFRLAKEAGFKAAFTTNMGHIHSWHRNTLHSLPRIVISYFDDLNSFKWKLSGFAALASKRF